jgi:hypothetical protein
MMAHSAFDSRATGYKNTADYNIFCGDWCIGRIYETRTGPESLRWFWALYAPGQGWGDADIEPTGDA